MIEVALWFALGLTAIGWRIHVWHVRDEQRWDREVCREGEAMCRDKIQQYQADLSAARRKLQSIREIAR